MGTMQFIAGANTITVNRPSFGYEIEYHLPIVITEKHPVGYAAPWDNDSAGTYDYRVLNLAKMNLPISQQEAIVDFFRSASKGRCEDVTLRLGATPTGFCPGGPDKGDVGDFTVRLIEFDQSGMLFAPWRHFEDVMRFKIVSTPSYALPSEVAQGNFTIGSVQNLLYPQNGFKPKVKYVNRTDLSRSGAAYSIDGLYASDSWESSWDQQCNKSKAAALAAFLIGASGRASEITITAPNYSYMWGFDQGSGGSYLSRFLGSDREIEKIILRVRHDRKDRFTIPLNFFFYQS